MQQRPDPKVPAQTDQGAATIGNEEAGVPELVNQFGDIAVQASPDPIDTVLTSLFAWGSQR